MIKLKSECIFFIILLLIVHVFTGCSTAPVIGGQFDNDRLVDGLYEGSYKHGANYARVEVTIKYRKIIGASIIEHKAWKGKKAEEPILKRIVEKQSTAVDAVSGATNSSNVIMNAVHLALQKAHKE